MRSSWALCGSRRPAERRRVGSAESTVSWGLTSIISRLWRSFQRPAERRRQAMLSAREAERQPVSCAADSVSWILRLGATIDSWAGGSEHLRRLDSGRATRRVPVLVMAIPAAFPAGCHAPIGCRHAAEDVGLASSFHGQQVTNRYICWTDGDFATGSVASSTPRCARDAVRWMLPGPTRAARLTGSRIIFGSPHCNGEMLTAKRASRGSTKQRGRTRNSDMQPSVLLDTSALRALPACRLESASQSFHLRVSPFWFWRSE